MIVFQLATPLDFETSASHVLDLEVEDSGGLTGAATVTVTVTDVNDNSPRCDHTSTVVSVAEATVAGDIYTPNCSDLVSHLYPNCSDLVSHLYPQLL